jgi:hypothetical protein
MNLCSFMQCVHLGLDQTLRGLAGSGRLVDREARAALGGERLALPSGPALAQLQPAIRAARLTFSVSATATKWRRWRSSCTPSSAWTATESPLPNWEGDGDDETALRGRARGCLSPVRGGDGGDDRETESGSAAVAGA